MINICSKKHLNLDAFSIENDILSVKILKDFGAKIVSLKHKQSGYEFLFQPQKNYSIPKYGSDFSKFDTSGIDEILPTIDQCLYPNSDLVLPDHGDLWALKWDTKALDKKLISTVYLKSLPFRFTRVLTLNKNALIFDYELENLESKDLYYLWAFHGLLNFDDSTEIILPKDSEIINVINNTEYNFDYTKLSEYKDKSQNKFYLKNPLDKGEISAIFGKQNLSLRYIFDTKLNKYLGIWITKGGFKGEYNFAIEPASGYYDSLANAVKNNKSSMIKAKSKLNWTLRLEIENLR